MKGTVMSRMLTPLVDGASYPPVGAERWKIEGVAYDNTAVKFWSALLDEVAEDYAGSNGIRIDSLCDDFLVPEMLDPLNLFNKELDSIEDDDEMDETMRELEQELDILGPPSAVNADILKDDEVVCKRVLPEAVVDSELLPVLLVWPLEWGGLSEFSWNRSKVDGQFTAIDPDRNLKYHVRFTLHNKHVSEGLFHRRLTIYFTRMRGAAPQAS